MGKVVHIYNTEAQKVCSKEYRQNKHNIVSYDFDKFRELKNAEKPICLKCANRIGKPHFSDNELFNMSQK